MGPDSSSIARAREFAKRIRKHALVMTSLGGSAHIGAALSMADIVAVLYTGGLVVRPKDPLWCDRDRFILSKGHAGVAIYAALAEAGFFDVAILSTHCKDGSPFSGHVSHKGISGVEISTGSLGHGLSVGAGMAYGARLDERSHRVFVLLSDGECDEGSIWEAILFAAHHHLDNLVAIVDYNKIQSLASVAETLELEPFAEKWRSFNWFVHEVDGHDYRQVQESIIKARGGGRPHVIIAHTIKGKGVSFMENTVLWHYRTARGQEFDQAMAELEAS